MIKKYRGPFFTNNTLEAFVPLRTPPLRHYVTPPLREWRSYFRDICHPDHTLMKTLKRGSR